MWTNRRSAISSLSHFVASQDRDFRSRLLTQMDPGRVISLQSFSRFFGPKMPALRSVAVVSGSQNEPELGILPRDVQVDYLSFHENPDLFDLCKDWTQASWTSYRWKYDLVLCEQVLEHLIDPKKAIANLSLLVKPGGWLHVSVPAINNRHGEPHFFYSGFATEALEHWLECAGLAVEEVSSWDSSKGSRMYSTCDWSPLAESGPAVFFLQSLGHTLRSPSNFFKLIAGRIANRLKYPFQTLIEVRDSGNAVSIWAIANSGTDIDKSVM